MLRKIRVVNRSCFFSPLSRRGFGTIAELKETASAINRYLKVKDARLLSANDQLHVLILRNKKDCTAELYNVGISATYNASLGTMSVFENLKDIREKINRRLPKYEFKK